MLTDEELKAIGSDARELAARLLLNEYHATSDPCSCGSCSPVAHPRHPLNEAALQLAWDRKVLLAEVKRLRALRGVTW